MCACEAAPEPLVVAEKSRPWPWWCGPAAAFAKSKLFWAPSDEETPVVECN